MLEQLRLLCQDEIALIEERTALINQLQAAVHEYCPAALEAFHFQLFCLRKTGNIAQRRRKSGVNEPDWPSG